MEQLTLVPDAIPPAVAGVDLRCCDVMNLVTDPELQGAASIIHADFPWVYRNSQNGAAAKHYDGDSVAMAIEHLDAAWDLAAENSYLVMWLTCPFERDWFFHEIPATHSGRWRWRYLSGGGWGKRVDEERERKGAGYHMRGDMERVLLYAKGKPKPFFSYLSNWTATQRPKHSEKPVSWLREVCYTLVPPDGLIIDFYAGRGSMARAAWSEHRRYIGAELDDKRHKDGMGALHRHISLNPRGERVR